ncbi:4244_t:CDS:2 [Funneliformis geosporum]|nr:4244_t:CDS:2 [Funneliformis geosporum]
MEKKISILQGGSIYFFYRPKVENSSKEVQRFFLVLQPQNQSKYQLLIVGKKQLPPTEKENYFLFLEAIKNSKEELLSALSEKHYSTKTRGERTLPVSHCLGAGKYLLATHNNHTHFIYQLTNPSQIKEVQKEFNLQKEDDYLISIKNPQAAAPTGAGLTAKQKVKFPSALQTKFANYSFIPLSTNEFLNYEGAELLLISKRKESLSKRENEVENCLENIHPDNLLEEFSKISSPEALSEIKELIRTEENKFQKYKFFNELQVLKLLRPLLTKYKLTLLLTAGSNVDLAKAKGSSETYAIKYMLSKFFLMPVKDEADPDYRQKEEKDGMTTEERKSVNEFLKKHDMANKNNVIKEIQELIQHIEANYQEGIDYKHMTWDEINKEGVVRTSILSPRLKKYCREKFGFPAGQTIKKGGERVDVLWWCKEKLNNLGLEKEGIKASEMCAVCQKIAFRKEEYFADKEQPNEKNTQIKEKLLRNLDKICIEQTGHLANAELLKNDKENEYFFRKGIYVEIEGEEINLEELSKRDYGTYQKIGEALIKEIKDSPQD